MSEQLQAALDACRVPCPNCNGRGAEVGIRPMTGEIVVWDCHCRGAGPSLPPAVLAALRAVAEACAVKCDSFALERSSNASSMSGFTVAQSNAIQDLRAKGSEAARCAADIRALKESIR